MLRFARLERLGSVVPHLGDSYTHVIETTVGQKCTNEKGDSLWPIEYLQEWVHPQIIYQGEVQHHRQVRNHEDVQHCQAHFLGRLLVLAEPQLNYCQNCNQGMLWSEMWN